MNFKFYPLSQSVCKLLAEHKILHLVNWWMFYKFFQFMLSINSETPFIIFILSRSFLDQCLSLPVKSLVVASASQQLITHYPAPSLSDWHYFVICHITIYKQLFYCQFTEIDLCACDICKFWIGMVVWTLFSTDQSTPHSVPLSCCVTPVSSITLHCTVLCLHRLCQAQIGAHHSALAPVSHIPLLYTITEMLHGYFVFPLSGNSVMCQPGFIFLDLERF